MKKLLVAAALMLGLLSEANAQGTARVVTTCGTLPQQYPVGNPRDIVQDINGNLCTNASGGGGGGLSVTDQTTFTQGTSSFTPGGGVFNDASTLSSGQEGTFRMTTKRAQIVDVDSTGNQLHNDLTSAIPPGTNTIGTVGQLPYPVGATPIVASATGSTGATTATLTGAANVTTYICSYSVRANATAAATVSNTIAPIASGITMTHIMWVAPLASGLGVDEQIFMPCLPASAVNTSIAVISGAPGSGGAVTVTAAGYRL